MKARLRWGRGSEASSLLLGEGGKERSEGSYYISSQYFLLVSIIQINFFVRVFSRMVYSIFDFFYSYNGR